jgi:predicted transcriptional regulator
MNQRKGLSTVNLKELYEDEGLSTIKLSQKLGVSTTTVRNELRRRNIPLRTRKEAADNRAVAIGDIPRMVDRYMQEGATSTQLAEEMGAAPQTILKRLKEGGAVIRAPGQFLLKNPDGSTRIGRPAKLSKELLFDLYHNKDFSAPQIAEQYEMDLSSVYIAMDRNDIPRRGHSEAGAKCWKDKRRDWPRIKAQYEDGKTEAQIAKDEGVSISTVKEHLFVMGTKTRPRGVPFGESPYRKEVNIDYIIEQNKLGRTMSSIAEELGISPQVLCKRTKEVEYTPKNNKRKIVKTPLEGLFLKKELLPEL